MNTLFESTPKQEADAIEMPDSAIPVVHEGSSTLVTLCLRWFRADPPKTNLRSHAMSVSVYGRLMLMVVGRGDACVDTHYCSNDGAQNHQEQLNDFSSTMPTFSPIVGFREDCCQVTTSHLVKKYTKPRSGCSMRISEFSLRRLLHVGQSPTGFYSKRLHANLSLERTRHSGMHPHPLRTKGADSTTVKLGRQS